MVTDAQKEARTRNWKIYLLRAMCAQIKVMHLPRELEDKAIQILDEILIHYDADTDSTHSQKFLDNFLNENV